MKPEDPLFQELASGFCHCTSVGAYIDIIDNGQIRPNHGSFQNSFSQSENSCCRKLDSVSLFDFETPPLEQIFDRTVHSNWKTFINAHLPVTLIFQIRRELIADDVIGSNEASERADGGVIIWPVEVCYPRPIPLEAVDSCIVTYGLDVTKYSIFEASLPTIEDTLELNREFRASFVSGDESYRHHTFRDHVFATKLDHDSSEKRVALRLSSEPTGEHGIRIVFEGVSNFENIERVPVSPDYTDIIDQVECTTPRDRLRESFEEGSPPSDEDLICKIVTDVRCMSFRAQSRSFQET